MSACILSEYQICLLLGDIRGHISLSYIHHFHKESFKKNPAVIYFDDLVLLWKISLI